MDRMEEYEALLRQPEELPPALEDAVGRAGPEPAAGGGGALPPPPAAWRGVRRLCADGEPVDPLRPGPAERCPF